MLANSCHPQGIGLVSFLGYKKLQDNIRQIHNMLCLNLWFINICLLYHSHPAPSVSQSKTVQQSVFIYLQADSHPLLLKRTAFSWNNTAHCVTLSPPHSSSLPESLPLQGLWFPSLCVKCLAYQLFNQLWFCTKDVCSSLFKDTLILCQKKHLKNF